MANKITTKQQELTAVRRYKIDEITIDGDGAINLPITFFSRGSWHIDGTFGASGSVAIQFSNDRSGTKWSTTAVSFTATGDFVEYYFGSFLQMRFVVDDFTGTIFSSLDNGR